MKAQATLIYDGACAFCCWWVRYWQRLGGTAVRYRPYQQALADFPALDAHACRAAIQLVHGDGERSSGAAAAFGVLALHGRPAGLWLYRSSRAFAACAEFVYRQVAARRAAAFSVARALWGAERYPAHYTRAAALFVRLLALIYVAAFSSFAVQVEGLIGARGILPATGYLEAAASALQDAAFHRVPTLFWLGAGDTMLFGACVLGALCAAAAAAGRATTLNLAGCWLLYLSLVSVGQDFTRFQWDLLLLESGALALLLPAAPVLGPFLFRLLLFRFMFLSGCVKLLSGDPSWAALSALEVHYETQPLPTPLAWYAHQLPQAFQRLCVVWTFVVELVLPWLIFAPWRLRLLAAAGIVSLELGIALTGNYNFFNLLTIALAVFLIDDARLGTRQPPARRPRSATRRALVAAAATLVLLLNAYHLARPFAAAHLPSALHTAADVVAPLRLVNGYGLFAVMTTERPEIEVQGSLDGRHWRSYAFRYKPGDPRRAPRWNVPHQPRLDWQMWFAALSSAAHTPWFGNFLVRLLQAEPAVLDLLAHDPFAGRRPRYVRALGWTYRFTSPAERDATGATWARRRSGLYYPAMELR